LRVETAPTMPHIKSTPKLGCLDIKHSNKKFLVYFFVYLNENSIINLIWN
jgi:hypothetical protein